MWSIASTTSELTDLATNFGLIIVAVLGVTLTAFAAYFGLKWGIRKIVGVLKGGTGV